MASIDPELQTRLIRDLEPAVAVELAPTLKFKKTGTHTTMSHGLKVETLLVLSMEMHGKQKIHDYLVLPKIL